MCGSSGNRLTSPSGLEALNFVLRQSRSLAPVDDGEHVLEEPKRTRPHPKEWEKESPNVVKGIRTLRPGRSLFPLPLQPVEPVQPALIRPWSAKQILRQM